ncbi:hypothetical protein GIB67_008154, partial [Kingdonia uniflora]
DLCEAVVKRRYEQARFPPRGWNSYDSFSWIISEEEFMQNAKVVSERLLAHGFEEEGSRCFYNSLGFDAIDKWGRVIPDPERWPSSKGGKGFSEVVANKDMCMDVTRVHERDTKSGAGRAFLRSLYQQYAEWVLIWEISICHEFYFCYFFIAERRREINDNEKYFGRSHCKNDCVFGDDLDVNEINIVSECDIIQAEKVSNLVNIYRITGDDWDTWRDVKLILTYQGSNEGPHRKCNLNLNEQRTQYHNSCDFFSTDDSLVYCKVSSIYGGDLRQLDQSTYNLITHPILLEINSFSTHTGGI